MNTYAIKRFLFGKISIIAPFPAFPTILDIRADLPIRTPPLICSCLNSSTTSICYIESLRFIHKAHNSETVYVMDQELPPHVLIFPLPLQGPVNSMFKLAELLCLSGIHVTFLVTGHIHTRLLKYSNIQSRFDCYPGFHLETISDGLPDDHPRSGSGLMEMFDSLKTKNKILFKDLLTSGKLNSDSRRPVTCIIADGIMGYTCDVANEVGIPIIFVRTISACCLWVFFCLPKLIEAGELPFAVDNDLDAPIKSIPGMEGIFRRRDLPMFCRSGSLSDPSFNLYLPESTENPRAHGLILNTFDDLEGPILSQIRTFCPNLYTIGPLHSHLKYKLVGETSSSLPSSNSLWQEDMSCITWLDSQPPKSVIYVSFGSLAVMTKEQYMEFWYGLVSSGSRFLWVIRPDAVTSDSKEIPPELSKGTEERGYIVGWAPQEEVLAHNAVGGFLTHSGWNSTLESVIEGVPMICWPYFLDQQVNSRFVGEVWKLGLDMKDTCDKVIIEKTVRELMEDRKDEFRRSADQMSNFAKQCLIDGGSSYCNLERLIKDIEAM
uniref:7-deoxyloganetic acid glucosyl transferase-like isoform X1 n=1 Tax=Erigeron canadensis TaxID=72917 RepID=UPI001CB938E9|nr:7-deoxyloganetic acid glucosyl transferase-like isoform X1 [Erigeron canadensis]XP_043633194.1 7-deoxyloganetic acid glucosyl transferase-like isoform X1 [Erigeron canadensis]